MINHTRTFLFNLPPYMGADGIKVGEIYIPLEFVTVKLKDSLQQIYNVIIPEGVSRFQRNYMTSVYMRLLHKPEYEPYTFFFDNRITYDIENQKYSKLFASNINIESFRSTDCNVDFSYNYVEENVSRNDILNYDIYNRYGIVTVETIKSKDEFSLSEGSLKHVVLIPSCLSIDLRQNGQYLSGSFIYTIQLKPASLLAIDKIVDELNSLVSHNAHIMRDLFTNSKCQEQLSIFKNIWLTSTSATDRLSAALLALIFNMTYAY